MAAGWVRELDPITGRPLLRLDGTPVELYPVRPVESLLNEAPEALAPSQYCLREWEEYIVRGARDVTIVSGKRDSLGEAIFRFRFENQVGRATLRFILPGDQMEGLLVEVLSTKYPTPDEHLKSFRALLDDLSRYAAQLPFTISGPTEATVDESPAAPTPLFVYNFLLQNDQALRMALDIILATPHRRLSDESRWVPVAEASVVDDEMLSHVLTHPEHLVCLPEDTPIACAAALRHHLPTQVWQALPRDTYDTPENRFARAFLTELLSAAQEVREQGWWPQVSVEDQIRISDLISYMAETRRASMFEEVGDMVVFPAASQVLLRRDGYRELLAMWRLFQIARQPLFAPLQAAIELRDVATLYEFWCFYHLETELTGVLGIRPKPIITVTDESGLIYEAYFDWGAQGRLLFNQSFSGTTAAFHSYSVALRPDFTFIPGPNFASCDHRIVIFDAKFRFESRTWNTDDSDDRERLVKRADLYKMHTYRDALRARSAIVLFPGDEPSFYQIDKGKVQPKPTFADLLGLEGVGAFSMEPGKE
jgi:uncharacterized protein